MEVGIDFKEHRLAALRAEGGGSSQSPTLTEVPPSTGTLPVTTSRVWSASLTAIVSVLTMLKAATIMMKKIVSPMASFSSFRALNRVAEKTGSHALEADALHFSSDIWSSLAVLAGLALASLGVYNVVLKATWTAVDDGVFWKQAPQGLGHGEAAGLVGQARPALHPHCPGCLGRGQFLFRLLPLQEQAQPIT